MGDGKAGFARGDFYAEPAPSVKMYTPGPHWHAAKVLFEKDGCGVGSRSRRKVNNLQYSPSVPSQRCTHFTRYLETRLETRLSPVVCGLAHNV
jgi:hypothetical protein